MKHLDTGSSPTLGSILIVVGQHSLTPSLPFYVLFFLFFVYLAATPGYAQC